VNRKRRRQRRLRLEARGLTLVGGHREILERDRRLQESAPVLRRALEVEGRSLYRLSPEHVLEGVDVRALDAPNHLRRTGGPTLERAHPLRLGVERRL
jgi:hypothetical protein